MVGVSCHLVGLPKRQSHSLTGNIVIRLKVPGKTCCRFCVLRKGYIESSGLSKALEIDYVFIGV